MQNFTRALLLFMAASLAAAAHGDEGMWTYDHFPSAKMRAKYGWAPDAAWLAHAQLASIRLAQGCSASLVSSEGLVMTNHHCVRKCLNDLADAQHDYIANGFYAATGADERKCPAIEANQLIEITDVTKLIEAATADKSGRAFHAAERAAIAKIESACGTAADVRCQVVTLYQGGVYDLYKYRRYQDVRVVFAPEKVPRSSAVIPTTSRSRGSTSTRPSCASTGMACRCTRRPSSDSRRAACAPAILRSRAATRARPTAAIRSRRSNSNAT